MIYLNGFEIMGQADLFPNVLYPNYILITMGRKKLNRTKEEIREQNRIRQRRFYERHSKEIKKEKLKKYYKKKSQSQY